MIQQELFAACEHPAVEERLEKSGPHHARRVCKSCKKFLGWVPKPETVARQQDNRRILAGLARVSDLTPWERYFIRDIVTHKHMSPQQQKTLLFLSKKYLEGDSEN